MENARSPRRAREESSIVRLTKPRSFSITEPRTESGTSRSPMPPKSEKAAPAEKPVPETPRVSATRERDLEAGLGAGRAPQMKD